MDRFTLRQKFLFGMLAVMAVSLLVMLGGRFLGKSARFHHLERDHLAAASAISLESQAQELVQAVVVFKLRADGKAPALNWSQ